MKFGKLLKVVGKTVVKTAVVVLPVAGVIAQTFKDEKAKEKAKGL